MSYSISFIPATSRANSQSSISPNGRHWLHAGSVLSKLRKKVGVKIFDQWLIIARCCKMLDFLSDFVSETDDRSSKPEKPAPSLSYKR